MYIWFIHRESLYLYANQQNNNDYFSTSQSGHMKTNIITIDFFSFRADIFCGAAEQVCLSSQAIPAIGRADIVPSAYISGLK